MMSRTKIFTLLLLGLLPLTLRAQQDSITSRLLHYIRNVQNYDRRTPQEKVYLHLDNNGYFKGETIWFKAYVVRASSLLPTDLSRVLYVELVSPAGQVIESKRLKVENGQANGEFSLANIVHSGFFEVRAYTRLMLNWDASYLFSRVVPVFDKPTVPGEFKAPEFYHPDGDRELLSDRPREMQIASDAKGTDNGICLSIYPEGGNLVSGVAQRVAFLLTDTLGRPLKLDCAILDKDHTFLKKVYPSHLGMGVLELPIEAQGGSLRVLSNVFPLPKAVERSVAVTVEANKQPEAVEVLLQASPDDAERRLAVCVTGRGQALYMNILTLRPGEPQLIAIPRSRLIDGVNQLNVYDSDGNILADRLFFQYPRTVPLSLQYAQDKADYAACSPVDMALLVTGKGGQKVADATFSLAIHDHEGDVAGNERDLCSTLLLTSDLRGYVANPDWYFEKQDTLHTSALDHLLMVQGWRRYDFEEMAALKPFVRKQPLEQRILFDGHTAKKWNLKELGSRVQLAVDMYNTLDSTIMEGQCVTDSLGRFIFAPTDIYGDWEAEFLTKINNHVKGYHVMLNRNFRPAVRYVGETEMKVTPVSSDSIATKPATARKEVKVVKPTHKETKKDIKLRQAQVKAKLPDRFRGNGGEARGRRYADRIYNMRDELDLMADAGIVTDTVTIRDWFHFKFGKQFKESDLKFPPLPMDGEEAKFFALDVKKFQRNISVGKGDWFKGRPIAIAGYNNSFSWDILNDFPLKTEDQEIKTVMISEDPDTYKEFLNLYNHHITMEGGRDVTRQEYISDYQTEQKPITVFLYNVPAFIIADKRGSTTTLLHGFVRPKVFEMPRYDISPSVPNDYRRTLYWNPNVKTNENGQVQIHFFTNSRESTAKFGISAQGIMKDGQMLYFEK